MNKQTKTLTKRQRRTFTPEFKAETVRLCKVADRSITRVATDLNLDPTTLREWVHRVHSSAFCAAESPGRPICAMQSTFLAHSGANWRCVDRLNLP